jgi:SAM-dependent methyltransferase
MANSTPEGAPDSLELIPCPLCGSVRSQLFIAVRDRLQGRDLDADGDKRYEIVTCSGCGFRFLNPRPRVQELWKYYQGGAYDPHRRRGGGVVSIIYRLLRPLSVGYKAAQVSRGLKPGSLLDVGCGSGEFLCEMKRRGWRVLGIEQDEGAAQIARAAGCEILVGDPLETDLAQNRFDLITFWHSLEHLPFLKGAFAGICAHLAPAGRLVVALPNPDSLDARIYKSRWAAWDAPRHLYHFRPADLKNLVRQGAGDLRLVKMGSLPLDPFYHALLSEIIWSRGFMALVKAIRGTLIGFESLLAGLRSGSGSTIVYVFQKP